VEKRSKTITISGWFVNIFLIVGRRGLATAHFSAGGEAGILSDGLACVVIGVKQFIPACALHADKVSVYPSDCYSVLLRFLMTVSPR